MSNPAPENIRFNEFVVLVAALMACQALAIDAMLPALPMIGSALNVTNENHTQWVVTAYMAGLGIGQLLWGMLSDRFGRRRILLTGLMLYIGAALLSGLAQTFPELLAWRFIHGAAAASTLVARSMVRDLYAGRQLARVLSLTFIVFIMVPMLAPAIGQLLLMLGPWRQLFMMFGVFGSVILLWVWVRLPETLHPEFRMTLTWQHISSAARLVLTHRESLFYTLAISMMFGTVMGYVGLVQQIFALVWHHPAMMPVMFAISSAAMAAGAYANSRIVQRFGMRRVSHTAILVFIGISLLHTLIAGAGMETLLSFSILQSLGMACLGLTSGNFSAMAMDPMGEVAGMAASLQGAIATVVGALTGAMIGRYFNDTTLPLALGTLLCGVCSLGFVLLAERGKLFRPHHAAA